MKDKNDVWKQIPSGRLDAFHFVWLILGGFIIGAAAGCVIAIFRITTDLAYTHVIKWAAQQDLSGLEIFIFLALALLAALITGMLILRKPIRSGGAAWIQSALASGQKHPFLKILAPKFLGTWLVMASGISVGREGPCIQMGASTALSLMRGERNNAIKRRFFILGGCAAGLAAAFSAPFSGICYVYEVMKEKIDRLLLLFMLAGSFGVYVSVTQLFGLGLMLPFENTMLPGPKYFLLLVPLGVFTGLVGIAYHYSIRYSLRMYGEQKLIPVYLRPILPFMAAALMALFFPAITGEGLQIFQHFQHGSVMLSYLFLFLAAKLLFTAFCYGSSIPAGLMVPIFCLGGVSGGIFGNVCVFFNIMPAEFVNSCIIMGMAGAFAASERAPITGLVLTLEMTGAWIIAPGMLLVAALASLCGRIAKVK